MNKRPPKFNFRELVRKHKLKINGVIHVGAHYGEEYDSYKEEGIKNLIFFEPVNESFKKLKDKVGNDAILVNKALGNSTGLITMNIGSNQGASSSILKPKVHLTHHPEITFDRKIKVYISRLDDELHNSYLYNLITIDVQGYELEVLYGAKNTLEYIDYIISEVNKTELYEGGIIIDDLDDYLQKKRFKRVDTTWCGGIWGDALYIKEDRL